MKEVQTLTAALLGLFFTATLAFAVPDAPFEVDPHTTFLAHFDGPGADADFAKGSATGQVEGELAFEEGRFGTAVKFGRMQINYPPAKNINPLKGTVEFWAMDLDFDHSAWNDQRIIFSTAGYGQGEHQGRNYLLRCLLSRNWVGIQLHIYGPNVKKDPGLHLIAETGLPSGRWQYCAAGWDFEKGEVVVRVGDDTIVRRALNPGDAAEIRRLVLATPPTRSLTIGQRSYVALDEFRLSDVLREDVFEAPASQKKVVLSRYGGGATSDYVPTRKVVTPHVPWARPYYRGATKVLVVENWKRLREVVELAQRAEIDFDVVPLKTDGRFRDRFSTMAEYEHDMILGKLGTHSRVPSPPGGEGQGEGLSVPQGSESPSPQPSPLKGEGEVKRRPYLPEVLILGGLSSKWFPDDVWQAVTNAVHGGMGLVWPGLDLEEPRVKELFANRAGVEGFLSNGPPVGHMIYPIGKPAQALPAATFGKGRVVGMVYENQTYRRYAAIIPSSYHGDEEYYFGLLARLVIWAADRTPDVLVEVSRDEDGVPAARAGHPITALIRSDRDQPFAGKVRFVVRDTSVAWDPYKRAKVGVVQTGRYSYPEITSETKQASIAPGENSFAFTMPALPQGYYSADVHLDDQQGRVIDWDSAWIVTRAHPAITNLVFGAHAAEPGGTMPVTLSLQGDAADATLDWELHDPYDRLLARGTQPATQTKLAIPVGHPLTRALWLHVKLRRGEALLQEIKDFFLVRLQRTPVFPYLMYGGISHRLDELGTTGHVTGTDERTDALIAQHDLDVFYWLDTPGLHPFEDDGAVVKDCLTAPATRQKLEEYFARKGDAIRRQKPIAALAVDEWSYMKYNWDQRKEQLCHSPTCLAGFRQFLQREYADLAALNREWDTDYANWDAIKPVAPADARQRPNQAPVVDLWRYNESKFADWLGVIEETARRYEPRFRIGMSGTRPARGYNAYDYWRLQNASHAIVNYGGPMPRESWSFAGTGHFLAKWEGYGSNFRETAGDTVWNNLAADMSCLMIYATFPDFGPFWPDWTITPGAAALRDAYTEVARGIAPLLKGATRQRDPIGIHYSQTSVHLASLATVPGLNPDVFDANLTSLERVLSDLGYQSRYVSYEEVENGVLRKEKFRAFILPLSTALSDRETEQIRAFAEAGGVVIADALPGLFDQHGRARERGALDDLFGVTRQERKLVRLVRALEPVADPELKLLTSPASFVQGEETLRTSGAQASAGFPADVPALLVKDAGKGRAVFLNLLFSDYSVFRSGGVGGEVGSIAVAKAERQRQAQHVLQAVLDLAGLAPVVRVENPTPPDQAVLNTEIIRYEDGGARYVMIHAPRLGATKLSQRATNAVTVHLPERSYLYDVRTGRYHGRVDKLEAMLIEGEPLILAMLPRQVRGLDVRPGRGKYAPGEIGQVNIVTHVRRPAYRRVYYIEVVGPDGNVVRAHTTNLSTAEGLGQVSIPLALDAAPGQWTVRVKDAATGLTRGGAVRGASSVDFVLNFVQNFVVH